MAADSGEISRIDLPYTNLLLTGFLGVGKSTVGRNIIKRLGVDFFDVDEEIEVRELMSIAKIREVYGDNRLKALENDYCRQAALMRRSVLVIPGAAMLDARNFNMLTDVSRVICLSCELGEALRRLHMSSEQQFRDATIRRRMLSRLRREFEITNDPRLLQLDTTHLTLEEETDLLIDYWLTGEPQGPLFHEGPPPRIRPPSRKPVGLSGKHVGKSKVQNAE
jgi:shikimate kinase